MYRTLSILAYFFILLSNHANSQTEEKASSPMPFVQQSMPVYPGGDPAMMNDIKTNLIYPPSGIEKKIEGKVFVQFAVEKDGSISDIKIQKGMPDHPEFEAAAMEAVKHLKAFTPAMSKHEPVRMLMTLPVQFKL